MHFPVVREVLFLVYDLCPLWFLNTVSLQIQVQLLLYVRNGSLRLFPQKRVADKMGLQGIMS